jgi:DNA-binding NtrC family response regulator
VNVVLIVDDEASVREILGRWLADAGYQIREAESAEAALEVMMRTGADVVMCDIEMPGNGGLWLAEQLRAGYPTSAMVLATALDSIPPATSFRSGIVDYLVKPFERTSVLSAVADAVTWHNGAIEQVRHPAAPRPAIGTWLDSELKVEDDKP